MLMSSQPPSGPVGSTAAPAATAPAAAALPALFPAAAAGTAAPAAALASAPALTVAAGQILPAHLVGIAFEIKNVAAMHLPGRRHDHPFSFVADARNFVAAHRYTLMSKGLDTNQNALELAADLLPAGMRGSFKSWAVGIGASPLYQESSGPLPPGCFRRLYHAQTSVSRSDIFVVTIVDEKNREWSRLTFPWVNAALDYFARNHTCPTGDAWFLPWKAPKLKRPRSGAIQPPGGAGGSVGGVLGAGGIAGAVATGGLPGAAAKSAAAAAAAASAAHGACGAAVCSSSSPAPSTDKRPASYLAGKKDDPLVLDSSSDDDSSFAPISKRVKATPSDPGQIDDILSQVKEAGAFLSGRHRKNILALTEYVGTVRAAVTDVQAKEAELAALKDDVAQWTQVAKVAEEDVEKARAAQQAAEDATARLKEEQQRLIGVGKLAGPLPSYCVYNKSGETTLDLAQDPVAIALQAQFMASLRSHRKANVPPDGASCEVPKLVIERIAQLHCQRLQARYSAEVTQAIGRNHKRVLPRLEHMQGAIAVQTFAGMDVNEHLLYHGAPKTTIDTIIKEGFDHRYAGSAHGAIFGEGVYFSPNASKSDLYTGSVGSQVANKTDPRHILVCRVCLGDASRTAVPCRGTRLPPKRADGNVFFDSVQGLPWAVDSAGHRLPGTGAVKYPENIVFLGSQALAQYKVTYRHADSCLCTHCS